jgi:hypothetical protein
MKWVGIFVTYLSLFGLLTYGDAHSNTSSRLNDSVPQEDRMVKGNWGGDQVLLSVSDDGASIEFACAHGKITERMVTDSEGKFSVKGTFVRERGGPTRQGEERGDEVTYSGSVQSETMTLKVLNGAGETIGDFTLVHGKSVRLRKCL